MDDDLTDASTGKRKRHDGKDPWLVLTREAVLADEAIRALVPGPIAKEPEALAADHGDGILIVLERQRLDPQGRHEALWCEVASVDGELYGCVLDNQPTWIRGLSSGDPLTVSREQVLRVARH